MRYAFAKAHLRSPQFFRTGILMKNVVYLFCFVLGALGFSQTPELFYEDGGDLGPLEIRNNHLYYLEHQVGLKELDLANPVTSNLLVQTEGIFGIKNIFWGVDGTKVYFSNVFNWYRSLFDITQTNNASFYTSFGSQYVWDIKKFEDLYIVAFSDFGTFYFTLFDVDPVVAAGGFGNSENFSRNVALTDSFLYVSDEPVEVGNVEDYGLFRGDHNDFQESRELLFDFNESIGQIEASEDRVYIVLRESNTIMIFDSNQALPWEPLHTIALPPDFITLEHIVIDNGDLYFTDSHQGNIYVITAEALAVTTSSKEELEIYPDPVGDFITLNRPDIEVFKIFDTTGKLITTFYAETYTPTFDVSLLSQGVYFGEITVKDVGSLIVKFVKD